MNFCPAKIDHQKLAIRKKSTFFRFSTPNFNTQLVIPISLHKKNLVKIGVRLLPEIKVQTEMELGEIKEIGIRRFSSEN